MMADDEGGLDALAQAGEESAGEGADVHQSAVTVSVPFIPAKS